MKDEWREMLEPISKGAELEADLRLFPSVFHFPGRTRESPIAPDALGPLQDVLQASVINFALGYATSGPAEQPKIVAAASAIIAAGPDVRIVVGGHMDTTGDLKDNTIMARRRAEGVIAELVDKRVPSRVLEAAVFEAVPTDLDHSRQVELLVK
jgi:outer membrane protein OmpA-like peptidoglycan-associated protein